ncbi:hypothetical protein MBLNU457_3258t1 [Dothideomycetes sp. NU457]
MPRTPVYFFSHGGPNIMEQLDHPAAVKLRSLGQEITTTIKPCAVIVFSAHWQAGPSHIEVNTAAHNDLIYDYYNFPAHYYEFKYPNTGSPELAQSVISRLQDAGIDARGVSRGLDHGVFSPFRVAFDPEKNPLGVPIVQVSLFDNEDPDMHYALGRAMEGFRDEGVLLIVSGMAVHNVRELRLAMAKGEDFSFPYATTFDDALKVAVEKEPNQRQAAMAELLKSPDARKAHPTFEHLLPIHIGAGAAGNDSGKQLWTMPQFSLAWAQYRFGEVQSAA